MKLLSPYIALLCICLSRLFGDSSAWHFPSAVSNWRSGGLLASLKASAMKPNARDLLLADSCSGLTRSEINEFVLQLEKQNPTVDPTTSPLLNGVWEVVSGGVFTSPGLFGVQAIQALPGRLVDASDVTITVSSVAPRVTATTTIKVGALKLDVSIITDVIPKSGVRLTETYQRGKLGALDIPLTLIKTFSRDLLISYLDQDLLIARDSFGTPEILRRKEFVAQNTASIEGSNI